METGGRLRRERRHGVRVNLVPKEGGNTYTFDTTGLYTNKSLQSDNLSDDCGARRHDPQQGASTSTTSTSRWAGRSSETGCGSSRRPGSPATRIRSGHLLQHDTRHPFYTPDLDRPAYREASIKSRAAASRGRLAEAQGERLRRSPDAFSAGLGDFKAPEARRA